VLYPWVLITYLPRTTSPVSARRWPTRCSVAPPPLIYQATEAGDNVTGFIIYVTVIIAVSLVVYIFFLKNRVVTALDREPGHAYELATGRRG